MWRGEGCSSSGGRSERASVSIYDVHAHRCECRSTVFGVVSRRRERQNSVRQRCRRPKWPRCVQKARVHTAGSKQTGPCPPRRVEASSKWPPPTNWPALSSIGSMTCLSASERCIQVVLRCDMSLTARGLTVQLRSLKQLHPPSPPERPPSCCQCQCELSRPPRPVALPHTHPLLVP